MGHSFRLRLALTSAALAGLTLVGFMAIAWWQMSAAKIHAIDREIHNQIEREIARQWPIEHWQRHQQNMARAFGVDSEQHVLLFVENKQEVVFQSEHLSKILDTTTLPWPPSISSSSAAPSSANFKEIKLETHYTAQPPSPALNTFTLNTSGKRWRIGLAVLGHEKLAIGIDLSVVNTEMLALRNAFLLAAPIALVFIALGAWLLSSRALSPIKSLSLAMANITAKGLDQRLTLNNTDKEFHQLIQVVNGMLERLARSFQQSSRFSADAAHELKTPLAILQGQIERALHQCEAGSPAQAYLTEILDEVQRLSKISRKLLLLSLADAGKLRLHLTRFNLSQALAELLEDAQMLAPELTISGAIAKGLIINADAELFLQLLHNLLSNALKYNIADGWLRIEASASNSEVIVSFANASTGIPAHDSKHIFDRFYRADAEHARQTEGVGLGLSLSREIACAHGGDLRLAEFNAGKVEFVVHLPQKLQNCN